MELTHTFSVPASVQDTWDHFMDLEAVGGCFPGATITDVSGDEFSGTVKVKLGPIALLYAGTGRFVERDAAAYRAVLEAKGKDRRGNGTAGATVTITLAPEGTGTHAQVVTDLAVTGKPAQFGRGVMQDVSDKLLAAFLECLEIQLADGRHEQPTPSEPPASAPVDAAADQSTEAAVAAGSDADASAATPAAATASGESSANGTSGPASRVGLGSATRPPSPDFSGPSRAGGARPRPAADDSLDLGAAVLPVLVKTYGPYVLAGVIGLLIGLSARRRGPR